MYVHTVHSIFCSFNAETETTSSIITVGTSRRKCWFLSMEVQSILVIQQADYAENQFYFLKIGRHLSDVNECGNVDSKGAIWFDSILGSGLHTQSVKAIQILA